MNPLRPYAPNNNPRNYGLLQGSARLLERIWQPGSQYRRNGAAWGLHPNERGRAAIGWLPSRDEALASYMFTQPELAPERIETYDVLRLVNSEDEDMGLILGGDTAYEIARVDVQQGLLVLESIETWARFNPILNNGQNDGEADELLSWDPGFNSFKEPQLRGLGTPFPFPIPHPQNNNPSISIEWVLILDRGSARQNPAALLGPAPFSAIPEAMGTPAYWPRRWTDQRYSWGRETYPQKWMATGPGVLRLFAKIITTADEEEPRWNVQVAGRLRGYQQPAGPSAAAFFNATRRH